MNIKQINRVNEFAGAWVNFFGHILEFVRGFGGRRHHKFLNVVVIYRFWIIDNELKINGENNENVQKYKMEILNNKNLTSAISRLMQLKVENEALIAFGDFNAEWRQRNGDRLK